MSTLLRSPAWMLANYFTSALAREAAGSIVRAYFHNSCHKRQYRARAKCILQYDVPLSPHFESDYTCNALPTVVRAKQIVILAEKLPYLMEWSMPIPLSPLNGLHVPCTRFTCACRNRLRYIQRETERIPLAYFTYIDLAVFYYAWNWRKRMKK